MNFQTLFLILVTVTLSACGQLALKMGVSKPSVENAMQSGIYETILAALTSPLIWLGLAIYGLSVALWLWVLAKVDLSVAYPFVGVSFLVTMLFGVFILSENVTATRIIGTILIFTGCVLVARSA